MDCKIQVSSDGSPDTLFNPLAIGGCVGGTFKRGDWQVKKMEAVVHKSTKRTRINEQIPWNHKKGDLVLRSLLVPPGGPITNLHYVQSLPG